MENFWDAEPWLTRAIAILSVALFGLVQVRRMYQNWRPGNLTDQEKLFGFLKGLLDNTGVWVKPKESVDMIHYQWPTTTASSATCPHCQKSSAVTVARPEVKMSYGDKDIKKMNIYVGSENVTDMLTVSQRKKLSKFATHIGKKIDQQRFAGKVDTLLTRLN